MSGATNAQETQVDEDIRHLSAHANAISELGRRLELMTEIQALLNVDRRRQLRAIANQMKSDAEGILRLVERHD
jgi:hypothetical protein